MTVPWLGATSPYVRLDRADLAALARRAALDRPLVDRVEAAVRQCWRAYPDVPPRCEAESPAITTQYVTPRYTLRYRDAARLPEVLAQAVRSLRARFPSPTVRAAADPQMYVAWAGPQLEFFLWLPVVEAETTYLVPPPV